MNEYWNESTFDYVASITFQLDIVQRHHRERRRSEMAVDADEDIGEFRLAKLRPVLVKEAIASLHDI